MRNVPGLEIDILAYVTETVKNVCSWIQDSNDIASAKFSSGYLP